MNAGKMILLGFVVFAMCLTSAKASVMKGEWKVDQDNYNSAINATEDVKNWGTSSQNRCAKVRQERTWYGDWSDSDLMALKAQIATLAAGGATYGNTGPNQYWVEFRTATGTGAPHGGANFVPEVAAFFSTVDWVETQACNNTASAGVSWFKVGGGGVQFWGLTERMNTAPVVGNWATPSTTTNIQWNSAFLDYLLVNDLINDANCRGLRMEDIIAGGWYNDNNLAKEWVSGTAAPRLQLFFEPPPPPVVPEPAGMGLFGLGLVGFALRRRRTE